MTRGLIFEILLSMKSKTSSALLYSLVIILVFAIGFFTGRTHLAEASFATSNPFKLPSLLIGSSSKTSSQADMDLFWKTWSLLDEKFVDTHHATSGPATSEDRVYGAIRGMVSSLGDPYTTFFNEEEADQFETQIEGNFEGVGMELGIKNNVLTVISALKSTPAEKAGIRTGDVILKVGDVVTSNMSVEEVVKLIRGKKGTEVRLTIGRENKEPFEVKVVRDVINLPTLDTNYDQKTGIFTITLYSFTANSPTLFRNALRDFVATHSNKLILDLRGNPGGYLDAAVDMASWFLPSGKVIVREDFGGKEPENTEVSRGYNIFSSDLKMVILVDGGSASASEILAGALSEYGVAQLVGTRTFGKGSVQEYMKLDSKSAIKITIARWLTPNGISISDGGLAPKVEVKLTPEDIKNKNDLQMQKAIELLR